MAEISPNLVNLQIKKPSKTQTRYIYLKKKKKEENY